MHILNESKGTPDLIVDFLNDKIVIIKKSILLNDKCVFTLDDENLKCHVVIKFDRSKIKNYSGNLNFKESIESNFQNCIINIFYPNRYDEELVIKTIQHELTHLFELYQIKDIYDMTKWKRSESLHDTSNQNVNSLIKYFRDIFYLSLPHEINARVSSLYYYLGSKKKVNLENELKKTMEWQNYLNLNNFEAKKLYSDLIIKFNNNKILLYYIFNEFNKSMSIKTVINSDIDLYNYLMNSKKYFKKVANDYKKRMLRIVNKIINEKIEYLTYSTNVVNYKDYKDISKLENRRDNLSNLFDFIDYKKYFD